MTSTNPKPAAGSARRKEARALLVRCGAFLPGAIVAAAILGGPAFAQQPSGYSGPLDMVAAYGADPTGARDSSPAFDAAIARGGYTVIPCGAYKLVHNLNQIIGSNIKLIGAGRGCVTINSASLSGDVIAIGDGTANPAAVELRGFTLIATATHTSGWAIRVRNGHQIDIHDVHIDYDGSHSFAGGISLEGGAQQYGYHLNKFEIGHTTGAGLSIGSGTTAPSDLFISEGIIAGAATGWQFLASGGVYAHDVDVIGSLGHGIVFNPTNGAHNAYVFLDHILSDTSQGDNWLFESTGTGQTINVSCTTCWGSTQSDGAHPGAGFDFNDPNSDALSFVGSIAKNNRYQGVVINAGTNISWTGGFQVCSNSQDGPGNYDGIYVAAGVSKVTIANGLSGSCNDGLPANQRYGINVAAGTGDYIKIGSGNQLQGNATGEILFAATGIHNVQPQFGTLVQVARTANYQLTVGDTGKWFNNRGAGGEVDFTLPAEAVNLSYCFANTNGSTMRIFGHDAQRIWLGGSPTTATTGNLSSTAAVATLCLNGSGLGSWYVTSTADNAQWTVN